MQWWRGLLHLFFPELCLACGIVLQGRERVLCMACGLSVAADGPEEPSREAEVRLAGRFPFGRVFAYAYFRQGGPLQLLLHQLKYKGRKDAGHHLGRLMGMALLGQEAGSGIDAIVPVPLYRKKEARRGYNQAAVIAGGIGAVLGVDVDVGLLRRVRDTGSQTDKGRWARLENVQEAFVISGDAAGMHLLLVDDVLTTGATLEACALQLLRCPGARVSIATVGIAVY